MKNRSSKPVLTSFFDVIRRKPLLLPILAAVIAGAAALGLIPPIILERIIDGLTEKTLADSALIKLAVLYFALTAASGLADGGREMLITVFGQEIIIGIRRKMVRKLRRLPSDFFISSEPGDTVSRIIGDVGTVEVLFESGIVSMVSDIVSLCGIWAVVAVKCPGLGLALIPVIIGVFFMTRAFQKHSLRAQKANREALGRAGGILPETRANLRTVRCLHAGKFMVRRYGKTLRDSFEATEKTNFCDAVYSPLIVTAAGIVTAAVMILSSYGGRNAFFFGMSAGSAAAVIAYIGKIFGPIESIGMEIQSIQSASAGISRIREFLNLPERTMPDTGHPCYTDEPAVRMDGVGFSYDGKTTVLDGFSMNVSSTDPVVLAGRTGVGKSTVLRLILGLYSGNTGTVEVFGTDPAMIPESDRRKIFGYVEQSFRTVSGSVRDQIALHDVRIGPEAVDRALRVCGLYDTVYSLPDGPDTRMSDGLFSQGQLQLLSVARAIVSDPRILLLDEITANLDSATEKSLLEAIALLTGKKAVISVSHRLYGETGGNNAKRINMN